MERKPMWSIPMIRKPTWRVRLSGTVPQKHNDSRTEFYTINRSITGVCRRAA